jgi:hypothetical protein
MILSRWRKDVRHILPLSSCGVSETPSQDESHRESLIREIYLFLNQNVTPSCLLLLNYINEPDINIWILSPSFLSLSLFFYGYSGALILNAICLILILI